jgi:hypothetical protein
MNWGIASTLAVASSLPSLASRLRVASTLPSLASQLTVASRPSGNSYESVAGSLDDEGAGPAAS